MTPHKSIECSPRGLPALINAGNILHRVGCKFRAAKHSAWGQRLSWREGKQDRGVCSSQNSLMHSSCSLHGGDQFPQAHTPPLCLPLPQWWEEEAQGGHALSMRTSRLSSCQRRKRANQPLPATQYHSPGVYPWFFFSSIPSQRKMSKSDADAGLKSEHLPYGIRISPPPSHTNQYCKAFSSVPGSYVN